MIAANQPALLQAGAKDWITKPIDDELILEHAHTALSTGEGGEMPQRNLRKKATREAHE